jgi:hypothetical protein
MSGETFFLCGKHKVQCPTGWTCPICDAEMTGLRGSPVANERHRAGMVARVCAALCAIKALVPLP